MPNLMTPGRLPCWPKSPKFIAIYRELDSSRWDGIEELAQKAWQQSPDMPSGRFDLIAGISFLTGHGLVGKQGVSYFAHMPWRCTLMNPVWAVQRSDSGDISRWVFQPPWGARYTIYNDSEEIS